MTQRPKFAREIAALKREYGIAGYDRMAEDFARAGFGTAGAGGDLYKSKLHYWINDKDAVPDVFYQMLDETYGLSDEWLIRLSLAELEDRVGRPVPDSAH